VIRTGEPNLLNDISDELLVAGAVDDEHLELLRGLGLIAALTAPLQARGQTFGALMLVSAESGRRFTDDDVALATELGRRAGLAVENARLYTQRTAIAHSLQVRLLPRSLPEIPGLEIAARYRAAGELIEVGGDFYDVFPDNGAWLVLVGDVSGKGAEAAAVTALVRYTLRAVAQHALPLTDVLRSVNEALIDERQDSEFCTVCLARYAPNGEATFDLVLAGHPLPLLLRRDGTVEEVGSAGTLLGVDREPTFVPTTLALAPGETLIFYTDGVTEAGAPDDLLGVEGLQAHLVGRSPQTADAVVAEVEAAAITHAGEPRDDMAILAMTARPAG
jgi:serine phosphatase RsbU (regulator of sigma subunit)